MKKIMFTAIALIAFSGVSMANTISDEEIIEKIHEKKEISKETSVIRLHPCVFVGFAVSDAILENGGSGAQAVAGANAAYAACMAFCG